MFAEMENLTTTCVSGVDEQGEQEGQQCEVVGHPGGGRAGEGLAGAGSGCQVHMW